MKPALVLLLVLAHNAAAAPSCEQTIAAWKKLQPRDQDRKRSAETAKDLLAQCRYFQWSASYRQCLTSAKPGGLTKCWRDEYERGDTHEVCEALLDHYKTVAGKDFAGLFADHDQAWIDDFWTAHIDMMRPWCIERSLFRDPQATCVRDAQTRADILACGEPVTRPSGRAAAPRSPSPPRDRSR